MARNDPQVNLRMPADLKERLDAAADKNKRSLTAEVVARLEKSWDAEGYEELAELFLETMKDHAHRAQREVEQYRQMAGTVRLLRYTIERMKTLLKGDIPDDVRMLLSTLTNNPDAAEQDPFALFAELVQSAEREELLEAEEASGKEVKERRLKIERLIQRLTDKANGT